MKKATMGIYTATLVLGALASMAIVTGCSDGTGSSSNGGGGAGGNTGGSVGGSTGGATGGTGGGACELHSIDATKYVIIGFWDAATSPDCTGDPIAQNAFPIDDSDGCYCWPGHSGENSADHFVCDKAAGSFTYDQYTSLTCGASNATTKTTTSECAPDVPASLKSKLIDMSACP